MVDNAVAAFLKRIPWKQSACQREATEVPGLLLTRSFAVGLEKHEKFKQGDSTYNEDELCFVCYKNCKWQAIHHSFGFRADGLADWLDRSGMDWPTGWLTKGEEEAERRLLFRLSQCNFIAGNLKHSKLFDNLMHWKFTRNSPHSGMQHIKSSNILI